MKPDSEEFTKTGDGYNRIKLLLLIALMLALTCFVIVVIGGALADNIGRLARGSIYVSVSHWDVPLLISVPTYLALTYVLLLRLLGHASEQSVKASIKIAVLFALIAIITRPIYGYLATSKMELSGYFPCWSYSAPTLMSPTVWVKRPGYCIENTGKVRKSLLNWMDSLPDLGSNVPVSVVEKQASMLMDTWEKEEREKYPHLYKN
jgi:hypothetical protein